MTRGSVGLDVAPDDRSVWVPVLRNGIEPQRRLPTAPRVTLLLQ